MLSASNVGETVFQDEESAALGYPRKLQEPRGWAFGFCVAILEPLLRLFTKHRWIDAE